MSATGNETLTAEQRPALASVLRHPCGDDRKAVVDIRHLACHCAGEIGEQKRGDVADFFGRHIALQWSGALDEMKDLREAADAGGSESLDRTGRDRIDANPLGTETLREVAHVRLEACL